MPKSRAKFRKKFAKAERAGLIQFGAAKKPMNSPSFGYRVMLVRATKDKRSASMHPNERKWGFRHTGRSPLLIISPS